MKNDQMLSNDELVCPYCHEAFRDVSDVFVGPRMEYEIVYCNGCKKPFKGIECLDGGFRAEEFTDNEPVE